MAKEDRLVEQICVRVSNATLAAVQKEAHCQRLSVPQLVRESLARDLLRMRKARIKKGGWNK